MKSFLSLIVVLAWFALVAQFFLIIENRIASMPETIIRYFTFFTILTNLCVAVSFSFLLIKSQSVLGNFFSKRTTLTAITVYITIVGIVYNIILRFLWNPQGFQLVIDELLHTVIPVLCIIFWILFVDKSTLKWKDAFPWLIYPLVYIFVILIRGEMSGYYPYPFIDVNKIGYHKILINSGILALGFLLVSFLFVALGKKAKERK